jgi:hypothetical protein
MSKEKTTFFSHSQKNILLALVSSIAVLSLVFNVQGSKRYNYKISDWHARPMNASANDIFDECMDLAGMANSMMAIDNPLGGEMAGFLLDTSSGFGGCSDVLNPGDFTWGN